MFLSLEFRIHTRVIIGIEVGTENEYTHISLILEYLWVVSRCKLIGYVSRPVSAAQIISENLGN